MTENQLLKDLHSFVIFFQLALKHRWKNPTATRFSTFRLSETRPAFPRFRAYRSKQLRFLETVRAARLFVDGDFTIMEGNKDFRDSLQSICPNSKRNTPIEAERRYFLNC